MIRLRNISILLSLAIMLIVTGCNDNGGAPVNKEPIVPPTTDGRTNVNLGCVELSDRNVDGSTWDHGQIDGDIITVKANDTEILSNHELDGPSNATNFSFKFDNKGFNYILLFAHNEGDIPPNTATIELNNQEFILSANLSQNGYVNIVVPGGGVTCADAGNA
ncbi:MAG: hypothetical protein U5J95_05015 [Balneolaceae bacterium]|nr:hypothetical protein [Balneolaceae bacterium]